MCILITILIIILIKKNVTIEKTVPKENIPKTSDVTKLDIKSKLVQDLYKSLNMDLINNTCINFDKCLVNENYLYIYYQDNKKLKDDEMLYMVLNKIYKEGKYYTVSESNSESSDSTKIIIDKLIVKEELKDMFNKEYKNFDNKLTQSNSCGIKEYTFTGETYELIIKKCKSNNKEYALTKILDATKKGNNVILLIEKYIDDENNDKEGPKEYVESKEGKVYETFKFNFRLNEDKYYLEGITKIS